jgi:predicted glycosyltransferase
MADRNIHTCTGPTSRMSERLGAGARILIYSHDTFGLGHLRRSSPSGPTLRW